MLQCRRQFDERKRSSPEHQWNSNRVDAHVGFIVRSGEAHHVFPYRVDGNCLLYHFGALIEAVSRLGDEGVSCAVIAGFPRLVCSPAQPCWHKARITRGHRMRMLAWDDTAPSAATKASEVGGIGFVFCGIEAAMSLAIASDVPNARGVAFSSGTGVLHLTDCRTTV